MKAAILLVLCLVAVQGRLRLNVPKSKPILLPEEARESMRQEDGTFANTQTQYTLQGFNGTTGYIVINATSGSSMFYWQVNKFQGNIEKDTASPVPLILWLQGGPGCSSEAGNLFEFGPWSYDGTIQLRNNTWALDYHLLFIDNPLGAGFSFANVPEDYVTTETQFANNLYYMLQQMAFIHPTWFARNRPLFIFGESYGGHWVPTIAAKILQENSRVAITGNIYLPLAGIAIGDGWTDPINQLYGFSDFGYALGLLDEEQRTNISYYEQLGVAQMNAGFWPEAEDAFGELISITQYFTGTVNSTTCGINEYNYRVYCEYVMDYATWCNLPATKTFLGVPSSVTYQDCNNYAYNVLDYDFMKSVAFNFPYILQQIPVLLYNGQDDYIVNVLSAENWIANLDWPGQEGYLNAPKYVWTIGGTPVGFSRSYDKLTQLIVMKAGHMAPHDQIVSTRDMVTRFITGKGFQN